MQNRRNKKAQKNNDEESLIDDSEYDNEENDSEYDYDDEFHGDDLNCTKDEGIQVFQELRQEFKSYMDDFSFFDVKKTKKKGRAVDDLTMSKIIGGAATGMVVSTNPKDSASSSNRSNATQRRTNSSTSRCHGMGFSSDVVATSGSSSTDGTYDKEDYTLYSSSDASGGVQEILQRAKDCVTFPDESFCGKEQLSKCNLYSKYSPRSLNVQTKLVKGLSSTSRAGSRLRGGEHPQIVLINPQKKVFGRKNKIQIFDKRGGSGNLMVTGRRDISSSSSTLDYMKNASKYKNSSSNSAALCDVSTISGSQASRSRGNRLKFWNK